jgi:phosphatidylinositol alpha-1,6-mannosyltransferase
MSPAGGGPPRHLLVTNDFPPKVGGIQSYLWELWRRLDPATYAVLTASSHPDGAAFDASSASAGIRVERVRGRILYFPAPRTRARVRRLAADTGASLVLFDPVLPLGLLGPGLGLPYGVVLHGAEAAVPARLPGTRAQLRRVLDGAALVVAAGRYPARLATALISGGAGSDGAGRVGARRGGGVVVEVPPGVDTTRIVPLDGDRRRLARRELCLPEEGLLVSSVSRLVPRKGADVLIEAARRLEPSFPSLTVAIAGTGREAPSLAAQVRRGGAPVHLLGAVSEREKAALLGASDVFAMACRTRWGGLEQEGFGIVFLEAAAAGVPQVAGDSGGAADAVDDGVTGVVVRRPSRPGDVAEALRRLLADDGRRRAMGLASRDRAALQFSYDALAAKLAAALHEVQG